MTALIDAIGFLPPLPLKPEKPNSPAATPPVRSGPSHRCRLCNRVYERADHLNRHLKSHENARPFKCDRCPKSFNRADLLTRHQAGHTRHDDSGIGRRRIERTDRVAQACVACVASKSKCQDQKPCERCQRRNIPCTTASGNAKASPIKPAVLESSGQGNAPSDRSSPINDTTKDPSKTPFGYSNSGIGTAGIRNEPQGSNDQTDLNSTSINFSISSNQQRNANPYVPAQPSYGTLMPEQTDTFVDNSLNSLSYLSRNSDFTQNLGFLARDGYFSQDLDFDLWDVDLDSIELAYKNISDGGSQAAGSDVRRYSTEPSVSHRDISKRHAAFERSPWLWKPTQKDHSMNDHADLAVDEEAIPSVLTPEFTPTPVADFSSCYIDSKIRDKLLSILFTLRSTPDQFPSFPSLSLLNNLIQVYFTQESFRIDQIIHLGTFNPKRMVPELLISIIAAGSSFISIPAVWKMGLALQEVARISTRRSVGLI